MRAILILSIFLVLAACGKTNKQYRPGDIPTVEGEAADRNEPFWTVEPADRTKQRLIPREEEIVIPPAPIEADSVAQAPSAEAQSAAKIKLLLNQMKVEETKISVGKKAGLVRFSAVALVEGKKVNVKLEGNLKEDSTADLFNVEDSDDNVRAEVFCRGEVSESFYQCDSLFVDLYYKLADDKFYREQFELESEQEKAQKAKEAAEKLAAASKRSEDEEVDHQNLDEEGGHGEIPEPQGTFVGRPERVRELFAGKKQEPVPAAESAVSERPPGKGPQPKKKDQKQSQKQNQKPSAESLNNSSSISGRRVAKPTPKPVERPVVKPAATPQPKPQPKPAATPVAPKPTPVVVAQTPKPKPTVQPQPTVKPQPTVAPQPTVKPQPTAKPQPTPKPVTPARVILDVNDEPNRPVDQAVGGYSGGGKLENSTAMDTSGPHHYFSKPYENQFYGTYDLVRVVKILASKIYNEIFPGIKIRINDFSKRRGGYIPPHQGHQNGLEADIGYLTVNSHKQIPQHSKIGSQWVLKMSEMWKVFKFLGGSDRVSLFYVNRSVKPKFCAYARQQGELSSDPGKLALRKMVAIGGHTSHFHLRMECGRYNPRCRTDGPPEPSTGC